MSNLLSQYIIINNHHLNLNPDHHPILLLILCEKTVILMFFRIDYLVIRQ